MDEQLKTVESKVNKLLSDFLKTDAVQEALYNVLDIGLGEKVGVGGIAKLCSELQVIFTEEHSLPDPNTNQSSQDPSGQKLESKDASQRVHEVGLLALVNALACRNNAAQAQLIASILHYLTTSKTVSARSVCFALLSHERLQPDNAVFWLTTFHLIKMIISGVDYKGVRELMKKCLEFARLLPLHMKHSQLQQAAVLCDLLELIFDRNFALLPGYFIVNELLKLYPDNKTWPHWRISRMLTKFVDECQKVAQMLSIIGRCRLRPIVEYSGHHSSSINSWKLDSATLKFVMKGALPYSNSLTKPQDGLVNHIFKQPYSKEIIIAMLDLQKKQKYPILEKHFVKLILESLEECMASDLNALSKPTPAAINNVNNSENSDSRGSTSSPDPASSLDSYSQCHCSHVTSMLVYFVVNSYMDFKSLVLSLHDKLKDNPKLMLGGRDHLIWSLLQFLSCTIPKYPVSDVQPVLRLIELLYPEKEPLPVPDCFYPRCAIQLSAMCILIIILRKAQTDNGKIIQSLPPAFTSHHELLQNLGHNPQVPLLASSGYPNYHSPDYRIGLLLNAYSTNQEVFQRPLFALLEGIQGNPKSTVPMPGINCVALGSTTPFKMSFLDSLTIHVKISMLHHISQHISRHSQQKTNVALAPALIETYARLLVDSEAETYGLKQYINMLLPVVFKNQTWGILHALLEMFTYRIHHSPPNYRIQLVSTIHHMAYPLSSMGNMNQLHLCMESSALRLITGLGNSEVMPSLTRFYTIESKANIISTESEELNRVIVLTMARAIHVSGADSSNESTHWCAGFLKNVMTHTPHTWAAHTLQCFPPVIAEFYRQHGAPRDTQHLKTAVEEEYRKWKSMSNENDIIAHFSLQPSNSYLFLCLLFKMVLETTRVPAEAYKVLERLGPRQLMAHVRTLCDFLVLEFSNSHLGQHLSNCVDTMNAIIWQYNIVPIDRLILCLALRTQEGSSEVQVCLFIIQLLLLRSPDFRNRVTEFVKENSPEHWKQTKWYEKHMAFHRKFPEKFAPETLLAGQGSLSPQHQTLPIYFTNVCLRFMPVLDIMIHRFLEVHQVHKRLETVLEQFGSLYKFHDRPITYLYNTLHYYQEKLQESPILKRQLVGAVIMAQKDIRPSNWALTEEYQSYLNQPADELNWNPSMSYYTGIVKRFVETLQGKSVFPQLEWRFNEFVNVGAHALHITCVELMALPNSTTSVANSLLDTVLKGFYEIPAEDLMDYINAIGLILSWLPEAHWNIIHEKVISLLQIPELLSPGPNSLDPFTLMNLEQLMPVMCECTPALTVALAHSFWHHASNGQVGKLLRLMKERIRPILKTEEQLIVLCHLVAPFLQKFNMEGPTKVVNVTVELYQALATVDSCVSEMKYQDAICDLLYHIKYQFIGDSIKSEVEGIIKGLRPSLQLRLRFITHLNIEAIESSVNTSNVNTNVSSSATTTTVSNNVSSSSDPVVTQSMTATTAKLPDNDAVMSSTSNPSLATNLNNAVTVSSSAASITTGSIVQ